MYFWWWDCLGDGVTSNLPMTFYPCTQCHLWNDGFQEASNLTLFRTVCRHDMHTYVLSCQGCIIVVEGTHLAHWWTLRLMLLDVSICSWILWPFCGKLVVWVCLGWQGFNILFCEYAQIPYFRYHHWLSTLETFWQIRDALWWFKYAPFTFSFAYLLLIADSGRSIWLMLSSIHLWVLLGFWHFQQIGVWILSCLELLDKASLIFICGCPPPGIGILNLLAGGRWTDICGEDSIDQLIFGEMVDTWMEWACKCSGHNFWGCVSTTSGSTGCNKIFLQLNSEKICWHNCANDD
jgi:hypothetical protein